MVGQCFRFQTPPHGEHLFIVLAPTDASKRSYLCVNISTKSEPGERCELFKGEHEALTSPVSTVRFSLAREFPLRDIEANLARQRLANFDPALMQRIGAAALSGQSRLKKDFQRMIRDYG
jgi:hypothetical protein